MKYYFLLATIVFFLCNQFLFAHGLPLVTALNALDFQTAEELILKGESLENDWHGFSPLMILVTTGNLRGVEYLLKKGALINKVTRQGTAFVLASFQENYAMMELLLKHGAWIDTKRPDIGYTVLHWAIDKQKVDLVKFLLQKGADCFERTSLQATRELGSPQLSAIEMANEKAEKERTPESQEIADFVTFLPYLNQLVARKLIPEMNIGARGTLLRLALESMLERDSAYLSSQGKKSIFWPEKKKSRSDCNIQ